MTRSRFPTIRHTRSPTDRVDDLSETRDQSASERPRPASIRPFSPQQQGQLSAPGVAGNRRQPNRAGSTRHTARRCWRSRSRDAGPTCRRPDQSRSGLSRSATANFAANSYFPYVSNGDLAVANDEVAGRGRGEAGSQTANLQPRATDHADARSDARPSSSWSSCSCLLASCCSGAWSGGDDVDAGGPQLCRVGGGRADGRADRRLWRCRAVRRAYRSFSFEPHGIVPRIPRPSPPSRSGPTGTSRLPSHSKAALWIFDRSRRTGVPERTRITSRYGAAIHARVGANSKPRSDRLRGRELYRFRTRSARLPGLAGAGRPIRGRRGLRHVERRKHVAVC